MRSFRRICVYCGSSADVSERFVQAAETTGRYLAERGIGVVYGGGSVGTMGVLADAALTAGGQVFGVIPEKLMALGLGHDRLTELFVVDSMHARKMMMAQLSDAFIALPGGLGTLEELFEVTTWTQLNYHQKPVGLLNVNGYYDGLLMFLAHAADNGFIRPQHRHLIQSGETLKSVLEKLAKVELPELKRWIEKP